MKLLIVDDSNIIRRKIERSTEVENLEVVGTASNGVEALEKFRELRPDVVTMDLTMPEMGGIECVERMVDMDPDVIILVVSALSDKATAIEALKKGANGFLCEPLSEEELNNAFREVVTEVSHGGA